MSVVRLWASLGVVVLGFVLSACGNSGNEKVFHIAGIPDQNASTLAQNYDILTDYLSQELGLTVEYVPTVKYAATVTSFNRGDRQRAWFGGLTSSGATRFGWLVGSGSTPARHRIPLQVHCAVRT